MAYTTTKRHRFGDWYLHLQQQDSLVGSRGDLQTDTLQTSVNEVEFWLNMTRGAQLEIKGRTVQGWKRLYFVDQTTPWTWLRIESNTPILQLRFVGELDTNDAFITIDDVETFSTHDTDMSWEITCFTVLGACVAILLFLECSRTSYCARSQRPGVRGMPAPESVPLGLELITVEGCAENEGKVADLVDSVAF